MYILAPITMATISALYCALLYLLTTCSAHLYTWLERTNDDDDDDDDDDVWLGTSDVVTWSLVLTLINDYTKYCRYQRFCVALTT